MKLPQSCKSGLQTMRSGAVLAVCYASMEVETTASTVFLMDSFDTSPGRLSETNLIHTKQQ